MRAEAAPPKVGRNSTHAARNAAQCVKELLQAKRPIGAAEDLPWRRSRASLRRFNFFAPGFPVRWRAVRVGWPAGSSGSEWVR